MSGGGVDTLHDELVELLGAAAVTRDRLVEGRASVDGATLSPILSDQLPLGLADLVVQATTADEIAAVVAATPAPRRAADAARGREDRQLRPGHPHARRRRAGHDEGEAIVAVEDGTITAEAGATMNAMEQAAVATGQQLWMYPSTAQARSAGSSAAARAGRGSIRHGSNWMGFVTALDVALPASGLSHLEGEDAQTFVHTYGTAGVIARATVRLEPLQDWRALYAASVLRDRARRCCARSARSTPSPGSCRRTRARSRQAAPRRRDPRDGSASLRAIVDVATLERP